jgi:hypothetical protein
MSQENVEVVRRALAALDRRDVEAYLGVASPQIELQVEEIRAVEGRVLAFFVITTADGRKIRRAHIFADRTEALEAVGLSE